MATVAFVAGVSRIYTLGCTSFVFTVPQSPVLFFLSSLENLCVALVSSRNGLVLPLFM